MRSFWPRFTTSPEDAAAVSWSGSASLPASTASAAAVDAIIAIHIVEVRRGAVLLGNCAYQSILHEVCKVACNLQFRATDATGDAPHTAIDVDTADQFQRARVELQRVGDGGRGL